MISKFTNVSTGPVGITREVQKALTEPPLSHRSASFRTLFEKTTAFLSDSFHVNDTFLMTGSGTLANEVMLHEIKYFGGKGLILSNGEFGSRLITQAHRIKLDFVKHEYQWGSAFDVATIETLLAVYSIKWILFCHCETSTGMINDLNVLAGLCDKYGCLCFADCMSTVGTVPLNFSRVSMATASSGKGLASVPGLAIVFSNMKPRIKSSCPLYLDLYHYKACGGIPFTIPSNLLNALYVSSRQKLRQEQYELITHYRKAFFYALNGAGLVPFSNEYSSVFTVVPPISISQQFLKNMWQHHLQLSYESNYLLDRSWCQLATFGYYSERQLRRVSTALNQIDLMT